MMRHTGQSVSLAIGTILIALYLFGSTPLNGGTILPVQYVAAMDLNFIVGAILAAIAVYFAFRGREPSGQAREIA